MTIPAIEGNKPSPEEEEAIRQESLVDVLNGAIYSVNDPVQRKTVLDLLNMHISVHYHTRLRYFPDANEPRYIMNSDQGVLFNDEGVLNEGEVYYRNKKLKEFDSLILDEQHGLLTDDEASIEEVIIEFCQEFSEGEIKINDFISGLKALVTRSVEFPHLSLTGRLDDPQMYLIDVDQ